MFRLNTAGQLTQGEWCIRNYGGVMKTNHCVKGTVDGPYKYDRVSLLECLNSIGFHLQNTQQIRDMQRNLCLTVAEDMGSTDLLQEKCDESNVYQKFVWTEKY